MKTLIPQYLSTDNTKKKLQLIPKISEAIRKLSWIQTFWLTTKNSIQNILEMNQDEREILVTLCPIYWSNGIDASRYSQFSDLPLRYKQKADMAIGASKIANTLFPSKPIKFILADCSVMIDIKRWNYNTANFDSDIIATQKIYSERAWLIMEDTPYEMSTFSELWVPLDPIVSPDISKTRKNIEEVLQKFGINPIKFSNQLDVIIRSFWLPNAYNLVSGYLIENQYLIKNYRNKIFLNTEFCWPLNSLYNFSDNLDNRLNQSSLFIRQDLSNS